MCVFLYKCYPFNAVFAICGKWENDIVININWPIKMNEWMNEWMGINEWKNEQMKPPLKV